MIAIAHLVNKYRRLLVWLGGLLLTYTLLGFFFLPWFSQRLLENTLADRLNLNTRVDSIYFNPFSFFLEVDGLYVNDTDQSELLQLDNLRVNFQASRLALFKLQFSEFSVNGLDFHFTRNTETDNNILRLAQRWSETAEPETADQRVEPNQAAELIPLEIIRLDLANISLQVLDEVPANPFATTLTLAKANVDNFSTLANATGSNSIAIQFEQNGQLNWGGDFTVNPLVLKGDITVENFGLSAVSRYLQESVPLSLLEGRLMLSFSYNIDLSQQSPAIDINDIFLELNGVQAQQSDEASPFFIVESLRANRGHLTIPDNRATFESLNLSDLDFSLTRNTEGELNLQRMIADFKDGQSTPSSAETTQPTVGEPWFIALDNFSVENTRVTFTDESLALPFSSTARLNATILSIDNQPQSQFPITGAVTMDSGGSIELDGSLQILPELDFSSQFAISELALQPLQAYLNELAFIELHSGSVSLNAQLLSSAGEPFSYQGDFNLLDVEISDTQLNETLLTLDRMAIDSIDLSLANNTLDVSELVFESLFARVIVNEDGTTNIGRSIKEPPVETANIPQGDTSTTASDPLNITVGRVQVDNAASDFTDRNLPIIFNANIKELSGTADGFATNSTQPMKISLEGQVDEFGLVQIDSNLNPFDLIRQSQLDLNFRNLDLPAMTPYVIKFAGREIVDGRVDVDLSYDVNNGELQANNQVVIRNLQLGERVEHPDAMDLPLDLATALLKDSNGVIDLEVPVTGNVNDPEFSFGPAIRRALANVLANLVAAPFRLLGSLIGGAGDDLDSIKFLPGRTDIAAPERQVLTQLTEALLQRPQLSLEIPPMQGDADRLALQTTVVDERIDELVEAAADSGASLTERRAMIIESLYIQAGLEPFVEEIQLLHQIEPEVIDSVNQTTIVTSELDVLAYNTDLRDRLILAEPISENDMSALADARRDAVVNFLTTDAGISLSQLQQAELQFSELDEEGWLIMQFDLGSVTD